jgi:hypothetical protein
MTAPGTATRDPITPAQLSIIPANQASWADLQAVFGTADYPGMLLPALQDAGLPLEFAERRGTARPPPQADPVR